MRRRDFRLTCARRLAVAPAWIALAAGVRDVGPRGIAVLRAFPPVRETAAPVAPGSPAGHRLPSLVRSNSIHYPGSTGPFAEGDRHDAHTQSPGCTRLGTRADRGLRDSQRSPGE